MWANSVWGLFGLAVTLGSAAIALPQEYVWSQPFLVGGAIISLMGSVLVLCWPLFDSKQRAIVRAKVHHPIKWLAELIEPSHIIILGLVIALVGAVWQWRKTTTLDPQIIALQLEIRTLKEKLAVAIKPTTPPVPATQSLVCGLPAFDAVEAAKSTPSHEVRQKKMEAIDLALKIFRDDLAELTGDAKKIINVQWDTRADGPGYWPEYAQKVVELNSGFEAIDKKINKFREQHRQFSDLYNIVVFWGQSAILQSLGKMISTVNSFGNAPNVDTRTLFEPYRRDVKEKIELVEQCRSETTDTLISFWKELSK